jgi:hypothetical protein
MVQFQSSHRPCPHLPDQAGQQAKARCGLVVIGAHVMIAQDSRLAHHGIPELKRAMEQFCGHFGQGPLHTPLLLHETRLRGKHLHGQRRRLATRRGNQRLKQRRKHRVYPLRLAQASRHLPLRGQCMGLRHQPWNIDQRDGQFLVILSRKLARDIGDHAAQGGQNIVGKKVAIIIDQQMAQHRAHPRHDAITARQARKHGRFDGIPNVCWPRLHERYLPQRGLRWCLLRVPKRRHQKQRF